MTVDTSAKAPPRSWADDLNSYRDTRGSRSLSTVTSGAAVPARYSRTNYVPFAATTHPLYPYNDFQDAPDKTCSDPMIQTDRYDRHGWGDVSLLKEDGYAGIPHPHSRISGKPGKGVSCEPLRPDGRKGLFEIMQQQNQVGVHDMWMGNDLIDPTKGKRPVSLPDDPKGRRDLFDVLHARNPGLPSDDSWLGHSMIDPAKGKAHPMGPEERRGRRDLQDIFTQSLLQETPERKAELTRPCADPLADGWIGHRLVNPNSGKLPVSAMALTGPTSTEAAMMGAAFRHIPAGHTDLPRRHTREVTPPIQDCAHTILNGTHSGAEDWGRLGRKPLDEPAGSILPRRDHLYSHMTYKPLTGIEVNTLSRGFDDSRQFPRRAVPAPHSEGMGKGSTMLHHVPGQRVGMYVPFAGLAQQRKQTTRLASQ